MKTITIVAIIYTICVNVSDSNQCIRDLNKCYKDSLKTDYINTFKPEHAKARALLGCLQRQGYIKKE